MSSLPEADVAQRVKQMGKLAVLGMAVSVLSMFGLCALQYGMPVGHNCPWGSNYPGVRHFQQVLFSGARLDLTTAGFVWGFRILTVTAWAGYIVCIWAAFRGGLSRAGLVLMLIIAASVILAIFFPPSLSSDAYAYVAYGRIHAIYGHNPLVDPPYPILQAHNDPVKPFLVWNLSSVYGPVWTYLSFTLIALLKSAGLWWQVVSMKLVAAAGLVVAALAGQKAAERISPGKGIVTLAAIGLNPLFLLDGPGNGHNDMLMMGLLLTGLALCLEKRYILGDLLIGASVGVKFIPIVIFPWLLLGRLRGYSLRRKLSTAATALLLIVLPTLIGYIPLADGSGIFERMSAQTRLTSGEHAAAVHQTDVANRDKPESNVGLASALAKRWPLVLVFALSSAWAWGTRKDAAVWTAPWIVLTTCLILLSQRMWFPWYLSWPLMVSLIRWDSIHIRLTTACMCIAVICMVAYGGSM